MMRVLIIFIVIAAVKGGEQPINNARIIGGEDASIEEYPYVGAFIWTLWGYLFHTCSGTLITRNTVVTAAHCFIVTADSYRYRFGGTILDNGVDHYLTRYIKHELHPDYDYEFDNDYDVAVARLSVPVTLSPQIGLARLPSSSYVINTDDVVTVVGWGYIAPDGPFADQLQHVEVKVIDQDICEYRYRLLQSQPSHNFAQTVTPRMMCTGVLDVGGKEACTGDFGGPVIHNGNVLVGITSWGSDCSTISYEEGEASQMYPKVNTRVSVLSEWIQKHAVAL